MTGKKRSYNYYKQNSQKRYNSKNSSGRRSARKKLQYRLKNKLRHFIRVLTSLIFLLLLAAVTLWMLRDSQQKEKEAAQQITVSSPEELRDAPFKVCFLDVGEADAALVQCGQSAMLIDGGNIEDGPAAAAFLAQQGVKSLDYVVATHPHEDHIGGIGEVLKSIPAAVVLSPVDEMPAVDSSGENAAFGVLRRHLKQSRIPVEIPSPGFHYSLGDADIEVLGPVTKETDNINNLSLVLRITYKNVSFLFTGDAEYQELQDITDSGTVLASDVLKVAHHGSSDAACFAFLEAVSPSYAVISVGADNEHYHPTDKILRMLDDVDARILRTDLNGTICITSDGTDLKILVEKTLAPSTSAP